MPMTPLPAVTLTPVAYFPQEYFLENLAVRSDGSVLITTVLQKELSSPARSQPRRLALSWCTRSTISSWAWSRLNRTCSSSA
jgi:hypothetical protein